MKKDANKFEYLNVTVIKNGHKLYGVQTTDFNIIILPQFPQKAIFNGEDKFLFIVPDLTKTNYYLFDSTGKLILKTVNKIAFKNNGYYTVLRNGLMSVYNRKNELVLPPYFICNSEIRNNKMFVEKNNKIYYVDFKEGVIYKLDLKSKNKIVAELLRIKRRKIKDILNNKNLGKLKNAIIKKESLENLNNEYKNLVKRKQLMG